MDIAQVLQELPVFVVDLLEVSSRFADTEHFWQQTIYMQEHYVWIRAILDSIVHVVSPVSCAARKPAARHQPSIRQKPRNGRPSGRRRKRTLDPLIRLWWSALCVTER
jgi:hypothetical protein